MNIGLALSGGGFRATVYHLGVLARLAEGELLEKVAFISTVSGGSLCAGLVYTKSDWGWPSSKHYLDYVLPSTRELLTTQDLQRNLILRVLSSPLSIFDTKADDLSTLMQQRWGITAKLGELANHPRWLVNATCYETGKNWRFERFRMGDYQFGYTHDTQSIPLSDAMAASAGFPGLIGALPLKTTDYSWYRYADQAKDLKEPIDPEDDLKRASMMTQPAYKKVHLWDGGAYDNLGVESLHNFITGWREGIDFLIISDASGRSKPETYHIGWKALNRIITGVMMDQIRSLRSRAILERFINHQDEGVLLQIGKTSKDTLEGAEKKAEASQWSAKCLGAEETQRAANMETVIRKLTQEEFTRLFRHGFELTDAMLYGYYADKFPYVDYSKTRWA
jgi:NTE family protein